MTKLTADRAVDLRKRAEIALHMRGTVQVDPSELVAALDDRQALLVENVQLKAEQQEMLNEVAVLRRHLSEREQQLGDMRATMVAGRRPR